MGMIFFQLRFARPRWCVDMKTACDSEVFLHSYGKVFLHLRFFRLEAICAQQITNRKKTANKIISINTGLL